MKSFCGCLPSSETIYAKKKRRQESPPLKKGIVNFTGLQPSSNNLVGQSTARTNQLRDVNGNRIANVNSCNPSPMGGILWNSQLAHKDHCKLYS